MSFSGVDMQIFALHQDHKAKGAHFRHPMGTAHPSHPWSSLLLCWIVSPPQPSSHKSRTSHIVFCSYLNNHSTSLKKVNKKLATPVDVKSKSHRLLQYTKSVMDYSVLLAEIQTARLAYHTTWFNHVWSSKAIPPSIPVDKIQADLTAQELRVVKISQITKTNKATQTLITKYPVFVVTASYDGMSIRAQSLYVSALTTNLLATHLTSVVSPPSVINHMQCEDAKNPLACLQNVSAVAEPTQPILPTVLTSAATGLPKADYTCFSVQASSLTSSQATDVSTLTE